MCRASSTTWREGRGVRRIGRGGFIRPIPAATAVSTKDVHANKRIALYRNVNTGCIGILSGLSPEVRAARDGPGHASEALGLGFGTMLGDSPAGRGSRACP